ncbi:MAG: hypothetical protein ACRECH_03035 [Nitrososphaerales archaeon]
MVLSGFRLLMRTQYLLMTGIIILVLVFSFVYFAEIDPFRGSQTSFDNTFTWNFPFPISVNYSGSWMLTYWAENGTATQNNVKGNISASGNYMTTVTIYGVGYVEKTLCANATKLDSKQNVSLTLTVLTTDFTNSTTASNPSVEVCATVAP